MKKLSIAILSIFLFSFFTPLQGQFDLEDGLLAFYPFNNNGEDESGNELHPDINETATLDFDSDGIENSAYFFDGVDDFIQVPNNNALNFTNGQTFSIAFWVKMSEEQKNIDGTVNDMITKWSTQSSHPYPYALRVFNQTDDRHGSVWVGQYDSNSCNVYPQVLSHVRINDGKWHHIVVTRNDDNVLKLFIDAELQGEDDGVVTCDISNDADILFGSRKKMGFQSRHFTGTLDNIRFYNRALTMQEIEGLTVKSLTSIHDHELEDNTLIYPNPVFNGLLKIKTSSSTPILGIKVYDSSGKFIFETKNIDEINVSSLKSGLFIFKIDFKNKESILRKIIIQNEFRV